MAGRQSDDDDLRLMLSSSLRPYEVIAVDGRGRAGVMTKEGPMTVEELIGHVLKYAQELATGATPSATLSRPGCVRSSGALPPRSVWALQRLSARLPGRTADTANLLEWALSIRSIFEPLALHV